MYGKHLLINISQVIYILIQPSCCYFFQLSVRISNTAVTSMDSKIQEQPHVDFVQHSSRFSRFNQLAGLSHSPWEGFSAFGRWRFQCRFYKAQLLHAVCAVQSRGEGEQDKEAAKASAGSLVVFLWNTSSQATEGQQD